MRMPNSLRPLPHTYTQFALSRPNSLFLRTLGYWRNMNDRPQRTTKTEIYTYKAAPHLIFSHATFINRLRFLLAFARFRVATVVICAVTNCFALPCSEKKFHFENYYRPVILLLHRLCKRTNNDSGANAFGRYNGVTAIPFARLHREIGGKLFLRRLHVYSGLSRLFVN